VTDLGDKPKQALIGIGSPFAEDVLGWRLLDGLQRHGLSPSDWETVFLKADRPGAGLLDCFSGFDRVVLLDAMQCEDGCCSLRWLQADDLQLAYGYSTHGFGVAEALKLGEKLGLLPEQWYLMGIGMEAEVDARTVACAARMIFDLPPFRPGPGETARDPAA